MNSILKDATLESRDGRLMVVGVLDFDNVVELVKSGKDFIRGHGEASVVVDLGAVAHCKSVGVALMTEWLRYAKGLDKNLQFVNIPEQMRAIIELCGLGSIFGFEAKRSEPY